MTSEQVPIPDGFPGQRMLVVLRARVREFLQQPGNPQLVVSACGYFPDAHGHGIERRSGISQGIILICVTGRGWCSTPHGRFDVSPGTVVLVPPGVPHAYGADSEDPWTLWWVHVEGPMVSPFLTAAGIASDDPVRRLSNAYQPVGLVKEALEWVERDASTRSLVAAAGAAWHLLTVILSNRSPSDSTDDAIERAAEFLRDNLADQVSVAELAAIANLSPSHFSAQFRKQLGSSVLKYQTLLRMARARELLDTTSQSIATIAAAVGYADPFYFGRQFRKVHEMTPRAYRARQTF